MDAGYTRNDKDGRVLSLNYYLDRNQILRTASNADVYNRGFRYFNEDRIEAIDFYNNENVYTVNGKIRGNFKYYTVKTTFDDRGILKSYSCDCDAGGIWRGACKHVVALLLKIFEMNQKKAIFSRDLRASKSMLDLFERQAYDEIDEMMSETANPEHRVTLVPMLNINEQHALYLTFTVGRSRQYILKNIGEFIRNMKSENTVSYGKNLEFKHKTTLFEPQSIRLFDLMADEYEYGGITSAKSNRNYFYYANALANKALFLSKRGLDTFFEIYRDQDINLDLADTVSVVRFIEGNPAIRFKMNISAENQCLSLAADTSRLIGLRGEKHPYLLHAGVLYRTEKGYYKTLEPMIKAFSGDAQNNVLISKEDVPRFMTFLYPRLREYQLLEGDSTDALYDIYEDYCPLVKKLYFDVNGKGDVLLKVLFCYGEKEVNPLHTELNRTSRNILEEYKLVQRLTLFGFVEGEDNEHYVLRDDEMIYEFYYSPQGLNALWEENETYATDEFLNKSVKSKAVTSFGIRLNGELLEVKIDTKNYNIKELTDIINAYQLKKKYHRLKNGAFISLEDKDGSLDAAMRLLSGLGVSEKELKKGVVQVPRYRALYLENMLRQNKELAVETDGAVESLAADFNAFKEKGFEIPATLAPVLRPYQKEGFRWLSVIALYDFGGILADDMGLGKTLEVISVLLAAKGVSEKPSIVVAPTSLIYNWEKEIKRFAPDLKTLTVAGLSSKRKETILNAGDAEVYITTYDMLKRDIELYKNNQFEYIIADEAQNIKNPHTQNAKSLKLLKGRVRFALTGTPIENSLMELWSIFDFIMPGYLYNNSKFVKHYESPIIRNNDQKKSEELRAQISPFILRRIKKDVLRELPEKIETTLYADMTEEQHKIYTAYLMKAKGVLEDHIQNAAFNKNKIDILAQLTRLRQICCHPAVFIDGYQGGSGKLALTLETIESLIESGHRLLIFSQFTSMLSIIEDHLKSRGIAYFYLDGATESKQRLLMADRFNGGERSVFLISLKAGGTGLNLTGADVVIHFDPWWNPAVMDQAADRAHRFGQKKTVQVINIVAKDSIEEKIMQLQTKKKDLVDAVIKEGASFINRLSEEEIVKLFEE